MTRQHGDRLQIVSTSINHQFFSSVGLDEPCLASPSLLTKSLVGDVGGGLSGPVTTVSVRCEAAVESPRRVPLLAVKRALNRDDVVAEALVGVDEVAEAPTEVAVAGALVLGLRSGT